MLNVKAKEIVGGLKAPQQKRLSIYFNNLSKDKDPQLFDRRMYDYLINTSDRPQFVEATKNYLDSIQWHQSKYEFSAIKMQLARFADANHPKFGWNKMYCLAKERLMNEFSKYRLSMLDYNRNVDIQQCVPRDDSNAGWSYILTGLRLKGMYKETLSQDYNAEEKEAKCNKSFNKPILIGCRTQASNPFNKDGSYNNNYTAKTRLVSMIDIYQIMGETKFARPLQNQLSRVNWYAGGKNDDAIRNRMLLWKNKYKYWISIDYSKYDQSISDWLIRDAFDIMRVAFHDSFVKFDDELFQIVREDLIHKSFIVGPNDIVESHKGVPSGSMFTQLVDSIVNRLMIDTYLISKGLDRDMMIMGDDNIIFTNYEVDLVDLSIYLSHNFGIEMNPEKCKTGICGKDQPEFLSREWRFEGIYRLPQLLIAKLLYPERYRDYVRGEFQPSMIVRCYVDAFPLGMRYIISDPVELRLSEIAGILEKGKWLDGFLRYRYLYNAS